MKLPLGLLAIALAASIEGGTQPATFRPVTVQTVNALAAAASQPVAVVSGDWNADAKTDLAVADSLGNRVSILLGDGTTTFSQTVDFPVGTTPIALVAGDFNLDGTTDLAVLNRGSRTVTILAGNATTFTVVRTIALGGSGTLTAMAAGNFDGDAIPDLAIASAGATGRRRRPLA